MQLFLAGQAKLVFTGVNIGIFGKGNLDQSGILFLQSTMPMVWLSASVLTWRSCGAANTGETRYVLQYAGSLGGIRLQGLRVPPGSCKLLKCLMLGLWHGRGHLFDPDQVHQITI